MRNVKKLCDAVKQTNSQLPPGYSDLFFDLSTATSTVGLFQVIDTDLLDSLKQYCLGNTAFNLFRGESSVKLQHKIREMYPVAVDRLQDMRTEFGMLPEHVGAFYASLIEFVVNFYNSLPERSESDYTRRENGEIPNQFFPHFPLLYDRPKYSADNENGEDEKFWNELCSKMFPEHVRLSPGLFLVTCACSDKKIYGFIMIIMGESPRLIFDIITTRFPLNYNPKWIYDAACRAKELGLNSEPRRMMQTLFCTDPVHQDNHTRCLASYQSTEYRSLSALNKEACEQFNSVLRGVASSVAYMKFEHYMLAMKTFIYFHNIN